jgi:hypothetical protein
MPARLWRGANVMSEDKLFGRINPEACAVNFEEIYKLLGEGSGIVLSPIRET